MKKAMVIWIALLALCCTSAHAESEADAAKDIIRLTKSVVAYHLKDPASTQFRNMSAHFDTGATCGEVNAKNSMGGYVGFRRFVLVNNEVTIESGDPDDVGSLDTIQIWCDPHPHGLDKSRGKVKP